MERFRERNQVEISDAFLEKLMVLEPRPAEKPRRRYVLPIAAAAALAIALGGWFAWRHTAAPEPAQTLVAIQSAPANDPAESMPEPSRTEEIHQTGTKEPKPQTPEAHVSEEAVPQKDPAAPQKSDNPASAKAEETAPEKPENATPSEPEDAPSAKPDDTAPANPENTAPVKPADPKPVTPDDPTPVEPDDPQQQVPDDPNPSEAEDTTPSDPPAVNPPEPDPPDVPQIPPEIGVVYLMADGREILTLTNLFTGESVEIDVTGWVEKIPAEEIPQPNAPHSLVRSDLKYSDSCIAFGRTVNYCLTFDENGMVHVEVDIADPE